MAFFRRFLRADAPVPPDEAADLARIDGLPAPPVAESTAETATVRRIVARLEKLPPAEARYLAAFAYIMSRAAHADLDISEAETAAMERYVVELGGLDESQAVVVVEMAKLQARLHGATEDFLVTREFGRIATEEQKLALLRCCFAVGAADDSISADEASVVNQIARELDLSREQLNAVRKEFHERLSAIQALRRLNQPG
ncbi:MAG TPA: TerB family tellurite resistance protein [Candidatus Limnocylindrales bacterium]|jgi:uncharacterized tellurite resistance protein B-like protein|nr:TerB family tellurite resistance protein [Candidatus Limnocylindrales bacterium]